MGPIGVQEMIAIFVIALLLFGPKKLPELGRTLGRALSEFRKAKNELRSTFETHMQELDREVRMSDLGRTSYSYPYDERGRSEPDYTAAQRAYTAPELPPAPAVEAAPGAIARTNGHHPEPTPVPGDES